MGLKEAFHLQTGFPASGEPVLLLMVGNDHIAYAFFYATANAISELKYFTINDLQIQESIDTISVELQQHQFSGVVVCIAFSEALLVPIKYAGAGAALMGAVYEEPSRFILSDTIAEWQIQINYALPQNMYKQLVSSFPSARFIHAYTPALKINNGLAAEDQISLHFTTKYFRALVKKGAQVLLMQTYAYQTPLDVVYYLLKICQELQLVQTQISLLLSGFINEDSALYGELHKYFLQLHFAQAHEIALPENDLPQHYFTSIYNLAACAL